MTTAESILNHVAPRWRSPAISAEDQAKIDAFIKSKGVTKVPMGGFPEVIEARNRDIVEKMRKRWNRTKRARLQTMVDKAQRKQAAAQATTTITPRPLTQKQKAAAQAKARREARDKARADRRAAIMAAVKAPKANRRQVAQKFKIRVDTLNKMVQKARHAERQPG